MLSWDDLPQNVKDMAEEKAQDTVTREGGMVPTFFFVDKAGDLQETEVSGKGSMSDGLLLGMGLAAVAYNRKLFPLTYVGVIATAFSSVDKGDINKMIEKYGPPSDITWPLGSYHHHLLMEVHNLNGSLVAHRDIQSEPRMSGGDEITLSPNWEVEEEAASSGAVSEGLRLLLLEGEE